MGIYWWLIAYTVIVYVVTYVNRKKSDKNKKIFLVLVGIPLILVMGLRKASVGVDTTAYVRNFSIICNLKWSDFGVKDYSHGNAGHYEAGYYYLNKIVSILTNNPQIFVFIVAIIIVTCTLYAIYLISDNVFLSVMMYQTFGFYCYSIALMRQFLAVPILLISFYYFINENYKKTIMYILIASLFHSTAFIFLGVYVFLFISGRWKRFRFIYTGLLCASIPAVYKFIITIVPRYQFYLTYKAKDVISSGLFAFFIIGMMFIPSFFKRNNKFIYSDPINSYFIQILIIGVISNLLTSRIPMLGRIVYMFTIFLIFYIPKMLKIFRSMTNKNTVEGLIIIAQLIYYYNFLRYATASVRPYLFFWQ